MGPSLDSMIESNHTSSSFKLDSCASILTADSIQAQKSGASASDKTKRGGKRKKPKELALGLGSALNAKPKVDLDTTLSAMNNSFTLLEEAGFHDEETCIDVVDSRQLRKPKKVGLGSALSALHSSFAVEEAAQYDEETCIGTVDSRQLTAKKGVAGRSRQPKRRPGRE
jgi:hypothetical protein